MVSNMSDRERVFENISPGGKRFTMYKWNFFISMSLPSRFSVSLRMSLAKLSFIFSWFCFTILASTTLSSSATEAEIKKTKMSNTYRRVADMQEMTVVGKLVPILHHYLRKTFVPAS